MIFRKQIEPYCIYCKHGSAVNDETVACIKLGMVSASYSCRHFTYAPLKRKPPRPAQLDTGQLEEKDFQL